MKKDICGDRSRKCIGFDSFAWKNPFQENDKHDTRVKCAKNSPSFENCSFCSGQNHPCIFSLSMIYEVYGNV
jgi:hypothetical protein